MSSAAVSPRRRDGYLAGARAGIGPAIAGLVLALAFGAAARAYGWGVVAPIVASIVVFSASGQLALMTALAGGGGAFGGVLAGALVTTRFLPMGVGLAPDLVGGRGRRALEAQAIVDPSWLAAHVGGGRFDRRKLLGATAVQWPCWVAGTIVGVFAAPPPELLHALGLDVVAPAFFLLLLIGELQRSRRARAASALAGLIAAALVLVLPAGLALIGSGAAAAVGLAPGRDGTTEGPVPDRGRPSEAATGGGRTTAAGPSDDARPADGEDRP